MGRMRLLCGGMLGLLAMGCLRDGPGFYGKVLLAGGNGQAANAQQAPGDNELARQVVRVMFPPRMRGVFNDMLQATPGPKRRKVEAQPHQPMVERWREGEVVIRTALPQRSFKDQLGAAFLEALGPDRGVRLAMCNTPDVCLWRLTGADGKALDLYRTREAAQTLQRLPMVRWSITNTILQALALPNDEYVGLQWHYDLMNLSTAWDVTTGDSSVVAAVIDTGLSTLSGDFTGRIGQGADMISDSSISNDGDGRDDDAEDPGDDAAGGGSFHGTHCAGTVGAATDNSTGVAGVSWSGVVLPVRVLGIGGGTSFDIIGGIQWALGLNVEGVSRNTRPADVLSLSLGGPGPTAAYEDIINDITAAGALVFVAAGNDNVDANTFTPAGVPGAITVGATNFAGGRASYSNYGTAIDIMAPGGELVDDRNGDGYPDGVLSTVQRSFDFLQGTSMATPHMAGLGVLMKSLRPGITQPEAEQLIKDTMRTDSSLTCTECGNAGLVDAAAVVAQLGTNANEPFLSVSPSQVFFPKDENATVVTVRNSGGSGLTWTAAFREANAPFTLANTSGTLASRESIQVNLSVAADRNAQPSGFATLDIVAGNQTRTVQVRYEEAISRRRPQVDEAIVGALVRDGEDLKVAKDSNDDSAAVLAKRDDGFEFKLQPLDEGEYLLVGITDDNGNGTWDDGEGVGLYPDLASPEFVALPKDTKVENLSFVIRPAFLGNGSNCPDNSSAEGQNCICNPGFKVSGDGRACEPR